MRANGDLACNELSFRDVESPVPPIFGQFDVTWSGAALLTAFVGVFDCVFELIDEAFGNFGEAAFCEDAEEQVSVAGFTGPDEAFVVCVEEGGGSGNRVADSGFGADSGLVFCCGG